MRQKSFRDFFGNFSALTFFYFAAMACYTSFYVAYLTKRGFSGTQIGTVVMLNSVVSILTQPLWGMLCDKIHSVKKVSVFLSLALTATVPVLIFLPDYNDFLFWIPFVTNLFYCSTSALKDTWIIEGIRDLPGKSYGTIRMWGSIGFTVTVAVMGRVSDLYSVEIVFVLFSVLSLIEAAIGLSIRSRTDVRQKSSPPKPAPASGALRGMFKNYHYVTFVFCAFLLYIPIGVKNNFLVQRVYAAGGSDTLYGIALAVAALSEVPVLYFSSALIQKFTAAKTLRFSMCVYALQFTALALPLSPAGILAVQSLQGLSYALFLVSSVFYIDALSPPGFKTFPLTFAVAAYHGAGGIVGSMISGILIDSIGIMRVYFFGSFAAVFAVLLFFLLFHIGRKKHPFAGVDSAA